MAYPKEVYEETKRQFEAHRFDAQNERELKKAEIYKKIPRLAQIEKELQKTGLELVSKALHAENKQEVLEAIKENALNLQKERCELLTKNGYAPDSLEIKYRCAKCRDLGYTDEGYCDCFKKALAKTAFKMANLPVMMDSQSFDTFRLDVYPEDARETMEDIYKICLNYAESFEPESGKNLFLYGATGLGKTFLSSCIAKKVLQNGFGVFYQPAYRIFRIFEEYKFGTEDKAQLKLKTERITDTDLLIIDDLGTEMVTAFTAEVLFDLINTRMNTKKPTIISTNLDFSDLETIYSARISSRIVGNYYLLEFAGDDIREM